MRIFFWTYSTDLESTRIRAVTFAPTHMIPPPEQTDYVSNMCRQALMVITQDSLKEWLGMGYGNLWLGMGYGNIRTIIETPVVFLIIFIRPGHLSQSLVWTLLNVNGIMWSTWPSTAPINYLQWLLKATVFQIGWWSSMYEYFSRFCGFVRSKQFLFCSLSHGSECSSIFQFTTGPRCPDFKYYIGVRQCSTINCRGMLIHF